MIVRLPRRIKIASFNEMGENYSLAVLLRGRKGRKRPKACNVFSRRPFDVFHMREALLLAKQAALEEEVPVGCVLVRRGVSLYWAKNEVQKGNGLAHAEILALNRASEREGRYLNDFTLYVNLEPCIMCAGALVNARIKAVVFGAYDEERGGCGSLIDVPALAGSLHHYDVEGGLLLKESQKLIQDFFRERRKDASSGN